MQAQLSTDENLYIFKADGENFSLTLPSGRVKEFTWSEEVEVAYDILSYISIWDSSWKWSARDVFAAVLLVVFLMRYDLHIYSPEHWDTLVSWLRIFQHQDYAITCAEMAKHMQFA